jgi:hypothetical protein
VTAAQPRAGARLVLRGIALYQAARSGRPTSCRFVPSCSAYAADAISTHGLARGTRLALGRLVRCRPFGPHGVDSVPPTAARAAR